MARFAYRLQGTLNLKEKLETQKKNEYGQAIAKLEEEKAYRQQLLNDRLSNLEMLKGSINKGISPMDIKNYNDYLESLKKKIIEQEKAIIKCEKFVEQKRLELVEAMKERKKLEKLRENAFAEYLEEEKKIEQKIVDEIVSYKYN